MSRQFLRSSQCRSIPLWFRLVVPALVLLAGPIGCSADRGSYSTLAASGVKLSTDTRSAILATQDSLTVLVEGRLLVEPYTHEPLAAAPKAEIDKLSKQLAARAEALSQLSKAYSAFANLANYDASGEVEGAVNDLTGAVNDFAKAVGSDSPPISGVTGKLVSTGGGLIAGQVQKQMLKKASAALRDRVTRFRDLLKAERAGYVGVQDRITDEAVKVAIALWDEGFGDPTGLIRVHAGDLTPAADSKLIIDRVKQIRDNAAKPGASPNDKAALTNLQNSVSAVLKLRADRRLELAVGVLDETIGSFDDLIAAHLKLEADQPITLDSLIAHLGQIAQFATELKKLETTDTTSAQK